MLPDGNKPLTNVNDLKSVRESIVQPLEAKIVQDIASNKTFITEYYRKKTSMTNFNKRI